MINQFLSIYNATNMGKQSETNEHELRMLLFRLLLDSEIEPAKFWAMNDEFEAAYWAEYKRITAERKAKKLAFDKAYFINWRIKSGWA